MKITKNRFKRIVREALSAEVPELTAGRKSSWQAIKEKELAKRRALKLEKLFNEFDELGYELGQMSNSDPDYEDVSISYDIMEEELESLGYEIPVSLNPFKVDSSQIRNIKTGKVVHKRGKK